MKKQETQWETSINTKIQLRKKNCPDLIFSRQSPIEWLPCPDSLANDMVMSGKFDKAETSPPITENSETPSTKQET